jgi:hypothetical protein
MVILYVQTKHKEIKWEWMIFTAHEWEGMIFTVCEWEGMIFTVHKWEQTILLYTHFG